MEQFPSWSTWSYDKEYLPKEFHLATSGMKELSQGFSNFNLLTGKYHELEYGALAVGLALRDMQAISSSGDNPSVPSWVSSSTLGSRHLHRLVKFCDDVVKGDAPDPPSPPYVSYSE